MSVIARKIAIANEPVQIRPDEARLADRIIADLEPILLNWLSLEEVEIECLSVEWEQPTADILSDRLVSCRGERPSQRAALCANPALADHAVKTLLRIDGEPDAEALSALRPFALQNMAALGARISRTSIMSAASTPPQWATDEIPIVLDIFEPLETLCLTLRLKGVSKEDLQLTLLMSHDMLISEADQAAAAQTDEAPSLPPRLGPCHVEVRAVGDRVSLSVADCTRLEIGQVVALPGLRFDQLDLDVEMGDGPVRLTDAALGADKGRKAVRLNRGLDPTFRERPESLKTSPAGVPE